MKNPSAVFRCVATIIAFAALSSPAMSASDCKGLEEQACGNNSSCTWIDSYKTSKGNMVQAYCRSKPVKQPARMPSEKQN